MSGDERSDLQQQLEAALSALNDCYSLVSLLYWRHPKQLEWADSALPGMAHNTIVRAEPLLRPWWAARMALRRTETAVEPPGSPGVVSEAIRPEIRPETERS